MHINDSDITIAAVVPPYLPAVQTMSNRAVRYWTDLLQHLSSLLSTAAAEASVRVAQLKALDQILDEARATQGLSRATYKKLIKDVQVGKIIELRAHVCSRLCVAL